MIIPSKQVLLITPATGKQILQFDPKTACVLHTHTSQSELAPLAAYYQPGQQFLIPHLNNTYVNVWDADADAARKFSVGDGERVTAMAVGEGNVLFVGSGNGGLYVYEMPSGILVRKVQLHSMGQELRAIILLKQVGYLITGTRKQVKLWPLRDILTPSQKPIPQHTLPSILDILNISLIQNILCLTTQKTLQFHYSHSLSLFPYSQQTGRDHPQVQNVTCCCTGDGALWVAQGVGKVREILVVQGKELVYQGRKGKVVVQGRKGLELEVRDPVTAMVWVDSLGYLVVGTSKGEVKIFHGKSLKNSVQLAKSSIALLHIIPRPSHKSKIPQSAKLKSLHKQELSKLDQPILFSTGDNPEAVHDPRLEKPADFYLQRMLDYLNDPSERLFGEVERVRKENQVLMEANLHYFGVVQGWGVEGGVGKNCK